MAVKTVISRAALAATGLVLMASVASALSINQTGTSSASITKFDLVENTDPAFTGGDVLDVAFKSAANSVIDAQAYVEFSTDTTFQIELTMNSIVGKESRNAISYVEGPLGGSLVALDPGIGSAATCNGSLLGIIGFPELDGLCTDINAITTLPTTIIATGGPGTYVIGYFSDFDTNEIELRITENLTAVPLPAAGLLLAGAFGALGWRARRKAKAQAEA